MCFRPCWPREAAVQCHSGAALSPSGMLTRTPPSAPLHPSSLPLPHSPATALPHLQAQRRRPTGHSLVLSGLGGLSAGLRCAPGLGGFSGGGVASEPGGWCQFAGKLQGLGTLLCRVHAARFGGCCQVWGASGFNVCSWIWAMLPSLRVISGLGGLKAAPAPVETSPAVPAAVPAVHFVRCWAPVWSCSTLWLVVSAARVAGWPPWRRAGVPPSDVFHLLCLR